MSKTQVVERPTERLNKNAAIYVSKQGNWRGEMVSGQLNLAAYEALNGKSIKVDDVTIRFRRWRKVVARQSRNLDTGELVHWNEELDRVYVTSYHRERYGQSCENKLGYIEVTEASGLQPDEDGNTAIIALRLDYLMGDINDAIYDLLTELIGQKGS